MIGKFEYTECEGGNPIFRVTNGNDADPILAALEKETKRFCDSQCKLSVGELRCKALILSRLALQDKIITQEFLEILLKSAADENE